MVVAILCGGKGTRLGEHTGQIPKPLIGVGSRPILWHIMKIYAHHGFVDFVLCLGHLGDRIRDYFTAGENWRYVAPATSTAPGERIDYFDDVAQRWRITFLETGVDTNTGGRVAQLAPFVDDAPFFVTYGDGVADIDLHALLRFHRDHGRIATLTAIQPLSQFGIVQIDPHGGIQSFEEKPRMSQWVNGGFFVFDRRVFSYIGPDDVLEREPFERLAGERQIMAYQHTAFWQCMDTYKDTLNLNALWQSRQAPWRVWNEGT